MKTYDRADLKYRELKEDRAGEDAWWAQHYDLWDFFHRESDIHVTLDDVRRGWLLSFLIKLGLKTPKEKIKDLHW